MSDYKATNAVLEHDISRTSLSVQPGTYTVQVFLRDLSSSNELKRELEVDIPRFPEESLFIAGGMIHENRLPNFSSLPVLVPSVSGSLDGADSVCYVRYGIYNPGTREEITVSYAVADEENNAVIKEKKEVVLGGGPAYDTLTVDISGLDFGKFTFIMRLDEK